MCVVVVVVEAAGGHRHLLGQVGQIDGCSPTLITHILIGFSQERVSRVWFGGEVCGCGRCGCVQ